MKNMKVLLSALILTAITAQWARGQAIELVPVVKKAVSRTVDLSGEVQPFLNVALFARVQGYVERVLVDRGSVVKQGELLVALSAPEMKAQIAAAESKVQAADADRLQAESKLVSMEATLAAAEATY